MEISIITGKVFTSKLGAGSPAAKRLYIKIFPGVFWYKPPRPKKAKTYGGELLIRYSSREWPEKKNGPLIGDEGLLNGISTLLLNLNLTNVSDISYAKNQHLLKETITISVGSALAKEMVDRGMVPLTELS